MLHRLYITDGWSFLPGDGHVELTLLYVARICVTDML
jgi:hypothetical protein